MNCGGNCFGDTNFIPFRQKIAQGQNNFTLSLPAMNPDSSCAFDQLDIVPSFFSNAASELKLDPDEEFEYLNSYSCSLKVTYDTIPEDRTTIQTFTWGNLSIPEFITQFNKHFEETKPSYLSYTPAFIDWCLTDAQGNALPKMNEYVAKLEKEFYPDHETVNHFGVLPQSVQTLRLPNAWAFPETYDLIDSFRLRLFLAPYTQLTFSNTESYNVFGFATRFNSTGGVIQNKNRTFLSFVAKRKPGIVFGSVFKTAILKPLPINWEEEEMRLSNAMLTKPSVVALEINKCLSKISSHVNMKISLVYKHSTARWHFIFPEDTRIKASIRLSPQLAQTLGYVTDIINRHSLSYMILPSERGPDYLDLARTLCIDTGKVIVTQLDVPANNLVGSNERLVADLRATEHGRMEICQSRTCQPTVHLVGRIRGRETIQVIFKLQRFAEDGRLTPLVWPCALYLNGMLVCKKCTCLPSHQTVRSVRH